MEIPGINPFNGQPSLTNPPNNEAQLTGQQSTTEQAGQTTETATVQDQSSPQPDTTQVVSQTNETDESGFNPDNPGGTIDLTA